VTSNITWAENWAKAPVLDMAPSSCSDWPTNKSPEKENNMQRRNFVTLGSTALVSIPFMGFTGFDKDQQAILQKPEWLLKSIRDNDEGLKGFAAYKVTDPADVYFGGYRDGSNLVNPGSCNGFLINASTAISCEESRFFQGSKTPEGD